ncbi:uncharacterized protein yc1106_05201 [Curvularia clavata]|uniref:Uncharacterized protein n=1 Tax=Curvularia clavata TaxID=95742 RepID=A0A9Q8Z994_CURCL|nr:uncharacterized protein yc1106_05201 [Curvularia clavata]
MGNWFGNLDLAYKYVVVFMSLLVLTIIAGFIKVLYNRHRLKKATTAELESGPKEDTVELNQREKDEGDLFGIRAIEAGFYAGVAQSRPTSRAGSVMGDHAAMSNTTLVGGSASSPLMKGQSNNASMLSLNLSAANEPTRPPMKLRPSEAELSGRHNHTVDMSLQVPPSPGLPRETPTVTIGSYEHDNDNFRLSPTMSSHDSSSNPSPYNPPTARLPTIPAHALRKDSPSPPPDNSSSGVQTYVPIAYIGLSLTFDQESEHKQSSSSAATVQVQRHAYSSPHDYGGRMNMTSESNQSSSNNDDLLGTFGVIRQAFGQEQESEQLRRLRPVSLTSTAMSGRTSILGSINSEGGSQSNQSTLLVPSPTGVDGSRLSEFYDAYYHNSNVGLAAPAESGGHTLDRELAAKQGDRPVVSPPVSKIPGAAF